jgi:hypothetical protein
MEAPKESLEKKNIFAEKYDEIRRLAGTSTLSSSLKFTMNMVLYLFPTDSVYRTAKKQYRKFEINIPRKGIDIPRKGIARPQFPIPHSCVCRRFIYSHDRSTYSAAGKYVD